MPKTQPLTLAELLNKANKGYADGFLSEYFDTNTGDRKQGNGDTLAEFIVVELTETFDAHALRDDQIEEARRVLNRAIGDLERVAQAILNEQR